MWVVLKTLGWIGIGLVAWMLLSVSCLGFLYTRGWLNPKRNERIREYEDRLGSGDGTVGERRDEEGAVTSIAGPRRAR